MSNYAAQPTRIHVIPCLRPVSLCCCSALVLTSKHSLYYRALRKRAITDIYSYLNIYIYMHIYVHLCIYKHHYKTKPKHKTKHSKNTPQKCARESLCSETNRNPRIVFHCQKFDVHVSHLKSDRSMVTKHPSDRRSRFGSSIKCRP